MFFFQSGSFISGLSVFLFIVYTVIIILRYGRVIILHLFVIIQVLY